MRYALIIGIFLIGTGLTLWAAGWIALRLRSYIACINGINISVAEFTRSILCTLRRLGQFVIKNLGRGIILSSACLAGASMFMNWVHFWFYSRTGTALGLMTLLALWAYPVLCVVFGWRIGPRLGMACALVSAVFAVAILAKLSNFAALGAVAFLLASILLFVGVVLHTALSSKIESGYG